jgi:DNA-binding transcriptional LysR family regulator
MDWDKLRIFHAAAKAGSFTHAGDSLNMSQSAVSRQVGALEQELGVPLFHRHARGLVLTEQGELLFKAAHEVNLKLEDTQSRLVDTREQPAGSLKVTTTVGIGSTWLTSRLPEFFDLYPDVQVTLLLDDVELDLTMRQADVAIRLRQPQQADLIQRKLFTVHFHLYASPGYLKRFGTPDSIEQLDDHRIVTFGGAAPAYLREMNWLETAGREDRSPRVPALRVNNIVGIKRAVQRGLGIALLPDYMAEGEAEMVQIIGGLELLSYDTFFVYPHELRNSARVNAFRDFLVSKAQRWAF